MKSTSLRTSLLTALLIPLASVAVVAAGHQGQAPPQTERVSIEADANKQFVGVQHDGVLAPWSGAIGIAEQFDLVDLGHGLIALRSAANGKYVRARRGQPLAAARESLGPDAVFRKVGGKGALVRLRAIEANGFVCADGGGTGVMTATNRCDHDWQLLRVGRVELADLAITAPSPGSALTTRAATFQWTGSGDEFWLNIGSAPGASDIHASGSLGPQMQHTVNDLPLNGTTLYVQLRRRAGAFTDVVNARYTAAIRHGLAVITDFSNRRLEDWTGDGMNDAADVSSQLREMEAHWGWLSRGLERIQWDIIRVTLAQPAVPGAFGGWGQFRDTVAALVRQQVATADYDVDGDGTIDAAWLVVSSGDIELDFAIGGSSRNAGVNMFVDGQASLSVVSGATGNFNHELGHLMGLVDMYGPYDTLHGLTLMSFSWPVPPHDFAAYERVKLGWVKPRVVTQTTPGVWLPSAHETLAAVRIPTARASEYFLIEYRRRPDSGYGSQNPSFDGLAIYHVLEGSSMSQDPPIVKLEPADGVIAPAVALDPADFVFPGNRALLDPLVLRSYFGDGPEIFRMSNVISRDGGIAFDVVLAAPPPPENLLANGSFESGAPGTPASWARGLWEASGLFTWPSPVASAGERSALLEAPSPNDMWWSQEVPSLVEGDTYVLCGSLKGEGIDGTQGGYGANVSLLGGWVRSSGLTGTFDWTTSCVTFRAELARVDVACRLGFYAGITAGRLWCDDLSLAHLRSAF